MKDFIDRDTFCDPIEAKEFIRQHNLDLRTVEQIVSYFMDKEGCRENWWIKKEVTRAFHGEKFSEIWPIAVKAIEVESKKREKL